jgi:hypothetical protein
VIVIVCEYAPEGSLISGLNCQKIFVGLFGAKSFSAKPGVKDNNVFELKSPLNTE